MLLVVSRTQPSNLNKLKQAAALVQILKSQLPIKLTVRCEATIALTCDDFCQGLDPKLTKAHLPKFPALEDELHKWVKDVSANNPQERPPVSMAAVLEKAQETALNKGEAPVCVCVCVCVCVYVRTHTAGIYRTHS